MNLSSLNKRVSFQVKVLVPVLAVLVLLMVATIWLVNRRIKDQLHENAAAQLDTAAKIFQKIQAIQANKMFSEFRNAVNEPHLRAVTKNADFPTIKFSLDELMHEMVTNNEATIATFTLLQGSGQKLISQDSGSETNVSEFQSRASEAIRQAAQGRGKGDNIRVGANLYDIVSFPVSVGDEITSVLTFGQRIGSKQARDIKQTTSSEIVFFADGRVAASSLDKPELYPSLTERFSTLSAPQAASKTVPSPELVLNHEHFLCRSGQFPSLSGDTRTGYLLLSSYEDSLVALHATQQMLFVVGLFGIGLSAAIVCFLIRRITRPLRQLRDSVEAVGRGDFSRRVETTSQDECGELATAFNQMTERIQTSREELEKTVATLKSTQHQLIQSEKLSGIGEFVAGVAHELNNPLTSVMGFSELLQQSELPEQQRRYLDVIFKSAKRCQKIVASLLSFARRHAPERKVVCLNEIVESAVEILQYQMRTSNIEVVTQYDPRLPATEVDPHQMQQVFLNIINNARQALEGHQAKGRLRVATESAQGKVRVVFQDNGPGIVPENLKRIFNPFFTTKEVGKGTGLGLSLCYGIVSEHGGTITPSSTLGKGATFVIELPATLEIPRAAEKAAAPEPAASMHEGIGKRVLVIDDEDMILQMIREVLTRNGYRVDIAHDGESALRRLSQYHYDLALCDWKMPGLNGQQVFERLQASNPEMSRRLIFITGDVVNEKVQEFLQARNKLCLSKPFTLVEFRLAIGQVLNSN